MAALQKPNSQVELTIGFILIVILVTFQVTLRDLALPEVQPSDSTSFSANRALVDLKALNPYSKPHPGGSAQNERIGNAIVDKLVSLGYQPDIQEQFYCNEYSNVAVECMTVRNIVVHIPGKKPQENVLLSAHYDSVAAGPGAADAGVAVGTLLEVARLMKDRPQSNIGMVLLFNEGEEDGLFGARAFTQHHPLAKQVKLALNIEARGSAGYSVLFETGTNSGELVKTYAAQMTPIWTNSLFGEVYRFMPNFTDFNVYHKLELSGLNFANAEMEPHYHTPLDNFENLNLQTLQHHGDNVWLFLDAILEREDLAFKKENIVFTDLFGWLLIYWANGTTMLLLGISSVLLVASVYAARKYKQATIKGVVAGWLTVLALVLLCAIFAQVWQLVVQTLTGTGPWRSSIIAISLSIWFICGFVLLAFGRLFAKKLTSMDLHLGLLTFFLMFAAITAVLAVGVSYLFIIPLLVILPITTIMLFIHRDNAEPLVWSYRLAICVVLFVFYPVIQIADILFSYNLSAFQGLIWGCIFASLLSAVPVKEVAVKKLRRLFLVFSVIFLAATFIQKPFTENKPQGLNLQYMEDDSTASVIAGVPRKKLAPELRQALPNLKVGTPFVWERQRYRVEQSESQQITPHIQLESQLIDNQLHLGIDAQQGHNLLNVKVYFAADSKLTEIVSREHQHVYDPQTTKHRDMLSYSCLGYTCANLNLVAHFSDELKGEVLVVASYMGLPKSKQHLVEARGSRSVPRNQGDLTMSVKSITLGTSGSQE
jgi:hypothetical protein